MLHPATNCLNCDNQLQENYCTSCGQKASTHRYSVKHFITHDFIHSVYHLDKGILFTIKQLLTRPGNSVREFIQGKRVKYFSYITLIILLSGIGHFLSELSPVRLSDLGPETSKMAMSALEKLSMEYPKLVTLFTIPFYTLFSYLSFRRAKMNGTEHLVMNTYKTAAELLIGIVFSSISIFYHNKEVLYLMFGFVGMLQSVYTVWFYYQYFSVYGYSRSQLLLRSILVLFLTFISIFIVSFASGVMVLRKG